MSSQEDSGVGLELSYLLAGPRTQLRVLGMKNSLY